MHIWTLNEKQRLNMRQRVYRMLERPQTSRTGVAILTVLMVCIVVSILVYFISSIGPGVANHAAIQAAEYTCTIVFTAELIVRLIVGTLDPWPLICCDITLFIDAASVAPLYVERIFGADATHGTGETVFLQMLALLRLLRVLKLLRHYSGWRVLSIALERSWRAIFVPMFAMFISVLLLSGLLYAIEASYDVAGADGSPLPGSSRNVTSVGELAEVVLTSISEPAEEGALQNAFESMWAVFWLVTTLGYDGHLGTGQAYSKLVVATALISGLLFTTMPITVLGGAFATAWEQKEVVEVAMKVQELLVERGHSASDVKLVFDAFDTDGSQSLDWREFKSAMRVLHINLPLVKMKRLFALFDADESNTIDHGEFCRLLFPGSLLPNGASEFEQEEAPDAAMPDGSGPGKRGGGVAGSEPPSSPAAAAAPVRCSSPTFRRTAGARGRNGRRGSTATREAAGGMHWHQWRDSAAQQGLIDPMMSKAGEDAAEPKPGSSDSAAEVSDGSSADSRLVLAARQAALNARATTQMPAAASPGADGAVQPSRIDEVTARLDRLEANLAKVLDLLQRPNSRDALAQGIVGGTRCPAAPSSFALRPL
jgi:hypothetical protein